MKRLGCVLVALLVLVAAGWWWQRPEQPAAAAGSLLGMLADENTAGYALATEPGVIRFPRDLGPHDDYQGEWWYYTGNLATADGRLFGYQLTFFRRALAPPGKAAAVADASSWRTDQIYSAHFAVSDIANSAFHPAEKFSREALGLAGARAQPYAVWLEDWYVREAENNSIHIVAKTDDASVDLRLRPTLAPILHGNQGLSAKGEQPGNATYYYSVVRQETQGTVTVDGQNFTVSGLSWNDHEYGSSALDPDDVGWDWFSLQFDNGSALMMFQIRESNGRVKPTSSGSFIASDGTVTHLALPDWRLTTKDRWTSQQSGAKYPVRWEIEINRIGLTLSGSALMPNQESPLSTTYWEGAVAFDGHYRNTPIKGRGYVEMTGYSRPSH
ncbi:lipocalin-like domain-containing protein [Mycobacterium riyadhense]|uniref:lipocalin-like domain-containing protein n=1 Tax=Mycobacterium riyadhense TaxID=486698 RepID=UPI00195A265D|nr:lipocalin-like domain-containing protein [Mycobacterium riyadhense]